MTVKMLMIVFEQAKSKEAANTESVLLTFGAGTYSLGIIRMAHSQNLPLESPSSH